MKAFMRAFLRIRKLNPEFRLTESTINFGRRANIAFQIQSVYCEASFGVMRLSQRPKRRETYPPRSLILLMKEMSSNKTTLLAAGKGRCCSNRPLSLWPNDTRNLSHWSQISATNSGSILLWKLDGHSSNVGVSINIRYTKACLFRFGKLQRACGGNILREFSRFWKVWIRQGKKSTRIRKRWTCCKFRGK